LFRAAGVPVVFSVDTDPVTEGLVASLNRPSGNLTGFTHMSVGIAAKRLEILHDLLPKIHTFAFLTNKSSSIEVWVRRRMMRKNSKGTSGDPLRHIAKWR
jgi:ABC-type uncharacterized transport system substrate-binding protein